MGRFITKDENGYERVVFGEVLIPNVPNVFGEIHTEQSIRDFAYGFMMHGFGINVHHDTPSVLGDKLFLVESFIARDGDPVFTKGAWVLGIHIPDDDLWQQVLDAELNGLSYEAVISVLDIEAVVPSQRTVFGHTQPDPKDGHRHAFFVLLDDNGRPKLGGTTEVNGHSHPIFSHTFTEYAAGHVHIYSIV